MKDCSEASTIGAPRPAHGFKCFAKALELSGGGAQATKRVELPDRLPFRSGIQAAIATDARADRSKEIASAQALGVLMLVQLLMAALESESS